MTKNYGQAAFLELHASGETDFSEFVMHAKFKVHKKMIDMGCAIEQFLELDKPAIIVYLIERGYGQEKYEVWKNHPDLTAREALSAKGLWPETFIKDKNSKSVVQLRKNTLTICWNSWIVMTLTNGLWSIDACAKW